MKTLIAILFAALLLAASNATAEEKKAKPAAPPPGEPKVIYKPTESHTFQGLKLKGQLKKPDLSYIYKRTGLRSEQIVDIPENFDDEIIQGAGQF